MPLRATDALAVFAGGAIGTAVRALVIPDGTPAGVFAVNLVGALALGLVTGGLLRVRVAERAARWRLFLGTGLLGGFTTYSAFAVIAADPAWVWWALATALVGPLLASAGVALARPRDGGAAS